MVDYKGEMTVKKSCKYGEYGSFEPHVLAEKLLCLNVDPKFTLWIVHFLLNRTQSIRF